MRLLRPYRSSVVVLAALLFPVVAYADNCGGLADCYGTAMAAAKVAAAIAVAIGIFAVLPEILAAAGAAATLGEAGLLGAAGTEAAADMGAVGALLDGAGPWVSEAVNAAEGGAVAQSLAGSCVSACGEMLSGGATSEAQFLSQLGEWSNPGALADALNALEGSATWEGGYFATAEDAATVAQQGQFGAVLQAPTLPSHMVVIEPGEAGTFLVRDPGIGGTYEVTLDWIQKWVSGGVF